MGGRGMRNVVSDETHLAGIEAGERRLEESRRLACIERPQALPFIGGQVAVRLRRERWLAPDELESVAWLPADPLGDAAGRPDVGSLVSRNIIPSPRFHQSSWEVTQPHTAAQVMGRYYPSGSYMSKSQFEATGCPFGAKTPKG